MKKITLFLVIIILIILDILGMKILLEKLKIANDPEIQKCRMEKLLKDLKEFRTKMD